MHPPSGPITISLKAEMESIKPIVEAAAQSWQTALGITINVQIEGTCTGGRCVYIDDTYVSPPPPNAGCAEFAGGSPNPDAPSEWNTSSTIRMSLDWQNAHSARNQRTVAHELGHYFGLFNRELSPCAASNTVMSAAPGPSCYSSQAPPAGTPLGPTSSDLAAIRESPYGGNNRKTCGWPNP